MYRHTNAVCDGSALEEIGGGYGIRTRDPLLAKQVLSH